MFSRFALIFGLIALLGAAYLYLRHFPATPTTPTAKTLRIAWSDAGYVTSEVCSECHQEIWEIYRRTGMGRSFTAIEKRPWLKTTRERTLIITDRQTATTQCTGKTAKLINAVTT